MGQELNGSLGSWVTLSDPFPALDLLVNCFIETEGLFIVTGIMYTVKVVISQKRCKIKMLLLQQELI